VASIFRFSLTEMERHLQPPRRVPTPKNAVEDGFPPLIRLGQLISPSPLAIFEETARDE